MKDLLLGQEPKFISERSFRINKRFYAACAAMQGLLAGNTLNQLGSDAEIAKTVFLLVDEFLKQENEKS